MRNFEYASPGRIEEAIGMLVQDRNGGVRPLAGGTDLLTLMKADVEAPSRLVDIKRLPGMDGIAYDEVEGLHLGALTRLAEIEHSPIVRRRYPMLAEALSEAATPQLRNMATLGGNLLQRPRCWYFRSPRVHCWLKGGETCPALYGENRFAAVIGEGPCYAAHPSDAATVLLALDAEVRLVGPRGERRLLVENLYRPPTEEHRTETVLEPDELLVAVRIPPLPEGARGTYLKAMDRKAWAFALVSVAAVLRQTGGTVDYVRLALGGVANVPWRALAAERELMGARADAAHVARAADAALEFAAPLRDNMYKVPLVTALIRRSLASLAED